MCFCRRGPRWCGRCPAHGWCWSATVRTRSGCAPVRPRRWSSAGAPADTAAWYRAADVVVLPSRLPGIGLAPLEAMACARPVVVTNVDGARETLPPGHLPSCLVPPEDPGALARAVTALLRDEPLRTALGAQARAHVLVAHDLRHATDAVIDVYRELLGTVTTSCVVPSQSRESVTS